MKSLKRYVEDPLIRSMRVGTWVEAVIQKSGKTTAELEQTFGLDGGIDAPRSCIWNKYRSGKVAPRSGRHSDGRLKLVERVEALYPGTAKWLFSPVWRLADKAPMEMCEIRQVYEGLSSNFREHFIRPSSQKNAIFWRQPFDYERVIAALQNSATFEVLVVVLALIREAEATQNHQDYMYWTGMSPHLVKQAGFDGLKNLRTFQDLSEYLMRRWRLAPPIET